MIDMKDHILNGWKEIEAYLGISRKTIIARDLPVYKNRGVYAFREELEKEMKKQEHRFKDNNRRSES